MAGSPTMLAASSPVFEQWRAEGGERMTYSEIGWTGAATALVLHASLHFFSAAILALDRFLVVFAPPERLAFGLTAGANPVVTFLLLLLSVAAWGAIIGAAMLATVHHLSSLLRRA
jgi:hypothetical protein